MSKRPRGFIENWKPTPPIAALISNVKTILKDNADIAPLTLRQIFYMLHSSYKYEKTEKNYKRLCETMNKARRARLVSMSDIRDDGLRRNTPHGWLDERQLVETFISAGEHFKLHRQQGQETHLMVWCEAGGMLPQLANYCEHYGVPVLSSGGFDSVTTKHNFALEAAEFNAVEILHIGDHDPSGVHMCSSLGEDLDAFTEYFGGIIEMTRLAVVPAQIDAMNLPSSPAKRTDNRSFSGLTTQAEAIPPRRLKSIVQDAITSRIDLGQFEVILERETEIRASLGKRLANL